MGICLFDYLMSYVLASGKKDNPGRNVNGCHVQHISQWIKQKQVIITHLKCFLKPLHIQQTQNNIAFLGLGFWSTSPILTHLLALF